MKNIIKIKCSAWSNGHLSCMVMEIMEPRETGSNGTKPKTIGLKVCTEK